jgi:hypothetical protein
MLEFKAAPLVRNADCNYFYKQAVPLEREFGHKGIKTLL